MALPAGTVTTIEKIGSFRIPEESSTWLAYYKGTGGAGGGGGAARRARRSVAPGRTTPRRRRPRRRAAGRPRRHGGRSARTPDRTSSCASSATGEETHHSRGHRVPARHRGRVAGVCDVVDRRREGRRVRPPSRRWRDHRRLLTGRGHYKSLTFDEAGDRSRSSATRRSTRSPCRRTGSTSGRPATAAGLPEAAAAASHAAAAAEAGCVAWLMSPPARSPPGRAWPMIVSANLGPLLATGPTLAPTAGPERQDAGAADRGSRGPTRTRSSSRCRRCGPSRSARAPTARGSPGRRTFVQLATPDLPTVNPGTTRRGRSARPTCRTRWKSPGTRPTTTSTW